MVLEILKRSRSYLRFSNVGEINNLLNTAKIQYQKRILSSKGTGSALDSILNTPNFNEDFDRTDRKESIVKIFKGVIGCESIITKLEGYRKMV